MNKSVGGSIGPQPPQVMNREDRPGEETKRSYLKNTKKRNKMLWTASENPKTETKKIRGKELQEC